MVEKPRRSDLAPGLPSLHLVQAALRVASIIGERAAAVADARESYWHHATGGTYAPIDLRSGEQLLIDCGLVFVQDGQLVASDGLGDVLGGTLEDAVAIICHRVLLDDPVRVEELGRSPKTAEQVLRPLVADEERRRELLLELGRRFDDTRRRMIGEIGEDLVVGETRAELTGLGRTDLAQKARRVSLVSDQLGYDVLAPTLDGAPRLLEVKTTSRQEGPNFVFFISRNEAQTGLRLREWALVACVVTDEVTRSGHILGWLPARAFAERLPVDVAAGRWTQAEVTFPTDALLPGLPRPVI